MKTIFELQADLNNYTFLENNCYIYRTADGHHFREGEEQKGNFTTLCEHIKNKPKYINAVRLPQSKEGMWIKIENEKSWETIQSWWVKAYTLAMQQELAELVDSTNWKWWRTKVDKFNAQNLKVEIIDVFHFWISQCLIMGMSAEDVQRIYEQKREVNIQRQQSGYLVKDEYDCNQIT